MTRFGTGSSGLDPLDAANGTSHEPDAGADAPSYPPARYLGDDGQVSARLVRAASDPDLVRVGGWPVHYLATGATTDGMFGLYRWELGPGPGGAVPHFHRTIAESFFVLSGEVEVYDGQAWTTTGPGDYLYVPPGGVHGFRNGSEQPASFLLLFTPGAPREAYFEGLAKLGRMEADERDAFLRAHDNLLVEP